MAEEVRNADLDAAVAANPRDPEVYRVYADWLEGQGDPRALLIRAHLDQDLVIAKRILRIHRERLLGPLASVEQALDWKYGFVHAASLSSSRRSLGSLDALLSHPSGRFLASLGITADDANPSIATLAAKAPPTLSALSFGSRRTTAPLRDFERVFARLVSVSMQDRLELVEPLELPRAAIVTLQLHRLSSSGARLIAAAAMPVVETLLVDLTEATATAGDLEALFERALPALTDLQLTSADAIDELCERLVDAPFAPQLERLGLGGELSPRGMRALLRTDRLAALKHIDVETEDDIEAELVALRDRGVEIARYDPIDE